MKNLKRIVLKRTALALALPLAIVLEAGALTLVDNGVPQVAIWYTDGTVDKDAALDLAATIKLMSGATMQFYVSSAGTQASETFGRVILRTGQGKFIHGIYNGTKNAFLTSQSLELVRRNRGVGFFTPMTSTADTATYNNPAIGEWRTTYGTTNCGNR